MGRFLWIACFVGLFGATDQSIAEREGTDVKDLANASWKAGLSYAFDREIIPHDEILISIAVLKACEKSGIAEALSAEYEENTDRLLGANEYVLEEMKASGLLVTEENSWTGLYAHHVAAALVMGFEMGIAQNTQTAMKKGYQVLSDDNDAFKSYCDLHVDQANLVLSDGYSWEDGEYSE